MKKGISILGSLLSIFLMAGIASAIQFTYHDEVAQNVIVSTSGNIPVYWVNLGFPDSTIGTYGNGTFEYDDYLSQVNLFQITLFGKDDDSAYNIDIFLAFRPGDSTYFKIAEYDVPNSSPFTLTSDIKNGILLYNGSPVGTLSNVNLQSFVGYDSFWVGYGCQFTHTKTEVNVAVNSVPEPSIMLLLGPGLIGIAGLRKKFKK